LRKRISKSVLLRRTCARSKPLRPGNITSRMARSGRKLSTMFLQRAPVGLVLHHVAGGSQLYGEGVPDRLIILNEQDTRGPAHAGSMPQPEMKAAALDSRRSRWRAFARSNVRVAQATPIYPQTPSRRARCGLPGDEQVASGTRATARRDAAEGPAAELSVSQEPRPQSPRRKTQLPRKQQAEETGEGQDATWPPQGSEVTSSTSARGPISRRVRRERRTLLRERGAASATLGG